MTTPKWRRFEELVKKIQSDLAPGATVTLDVKVPGITSGVDRQIDIAVYQQVGQFNLFIAIDCKDLSNPVDVKDVEEVMGLVQDVGANKGAIVAANGFTKAALKRGKAVGLSLYRLVDTGDHDWKSDVIIPVFVNITGLVTCHYTLQATGRCILPTDDLSDLQVYNPNHDPLGSIGDLFRKYWQSKDIPKTSGHYDAVKFIDSDTFSNYGTEFLKVEITADFEVENKLYYHNLPLTAVSGFRDEVDGKVVTKGFTTASMNVNDILSKWQQLDSLSAIAVRPVMTFWMREGI